MPFCFSDFCILKIFKKDKFVNRCKIHNEIKVDFNGFFIVGYKLDTCNYIMKRHGNFGSKVTRILKPF